MPSTNKIGGWHCHNLLCIPVDRGNNMSKYQMTELAIKKPERFPNRIEFIWSIHVVVNKENGQTPAKFDNVIDNIFMVVCGVTIWH